MGKVEKLHIKQGVDGTITVLLSFVFLLVLSFVLTTLEAARLRVVQSTMVDSMYAAMNGMFSEFYNPLYEEYHIFGYNKSMYSLSIEDQFKEKVESAVAYTMNPTLDVSHKIGYLEYLDTAIMDTNLSKATYLSDYGGNLFYTQAINFMKYYEVGELADHFLRKLNLLNNNQTVAKVYERKIELEEELVVIDKTIMSLMEIIDGIDFEDQQLNRSKDGEIQVNSAFIKKYTPYPITMEGLNLHHEVIYNVIAPKCINPQEQLQEKLLMVDSFYKDCVQREVIEDKITSINKLMVSLNESLKTIKSEKDGLSKSLEQLQENYDRLEKKNDKNQYETQLKELENQILQVRNQLNEVTNLEVNINEQLEANAKELSLCEQEKTDLSVKLDAYYYELLEFSENFITMLSQLQLLSQEGVTLLEEGIIVQQGASNKLKKYGKSLEEYKDVLEPEMYASLEEDYQALEKYSGASSEGQMNMYDFTHMKDTLSYNEILYAEMLNKYVGLQENYNSSHIQQVKSALSYLITTFHKISFESLEFDYSTLSLGNSTANPVKTLKGTLDQGIMSLCLENPKAISEKQITTEGLPSINHNAAGARNDFYETESGNLLDQVSVGNNNTGFDKVLSAFGDIGGGSYDGKELTSDLTKLLLFQEYANTHFKSYGDVKEQGGVRMLPSALDYELEYILFEQSTDTGNLSSTVNTLLLFRTINNFISLMSNKERSYEARALATALVGFTGLTILVSITKMIILLVWALEEALVDVSIMLMGKKVPFLKKDKDWHMKSSDLLLISKALIQQKAKAYKEPNSGLSFGYTDYLNLFILLKSKEAKAYLMMDLIQLNLKCRYEEPFTVDECMVGCAGTITYKVKNKFIALPYVRNLLQWEEDGFLYQHKVGYTY